MSRIDRMSTCTATLLRYRHRNGRMHLDGGVFPLAQQFPKCSVESILLYKQENSRCLDALDIPSLDRRHVGRRAFDLAGP